jgi:hypothetical protein
MPGLVLVAPKPGGAKVTMPSYHLRSLTGRQADVLTVDRPTSEPSWRRAARLAGALAILARERDDRQLAEASRAAAVLSDDLRTERRELAGARS